MGDKPGGPVRPVYDNYEISPCRRFEEADSPGRFYFEVCEPSEADVWTLYGHITGQGVEAIGDFHSREAAEEVFYRITGEAYGSHEQVVNRLRLMHAAPLLLEALEPYAIYAKNRMEWANGEDNEDAVDYIARKSVHAYTEATPRPPGADAVMRQIERLLKAGYFSDWDDPNKVCPDFAGLNASYVTWMVLGWENLDRSQQKQMLREFVDWDGFDHPSSDRVKRNVLDGRPKEEWFAALDTRLRAKAADASQPTRPGPEETPLERAERQVGHIKLRPDPYDFSIEDLGPWDTGVNEEWKRLPESDKLSLLVRQVDWRDVSPEDRHALLGREVDFAQVPDEARTKLLGEASREGNGTGGAAAGPPDRGEYQVWHITDYAQALLNQFRGAADPAFPEAYTQVGTVQADSLDQVFSLTNHGENPWQENPGVVGTEARSTSVGDVIVDPLGRPYRVEDTGFRELPSLNESPLERIERQLREVKQEPEIYLESTWHYVQPDPESYEGIYDTCDTLGPWHTLDDAAKLRVLTAEFDWSGVSPEDKRRLLDREVDLARVPEEARTKFLGEAAREGSQIGGAVAGPPGSGEYQVWHDGGWPQSRLDQMLGGAPPSHFPQDYFHTADVRAGRLEEAVRLTTGTGHVLKGDHRPWDRNSDVRSYTPEPFVPRDTDAGDVIVDPQGKAFRYDGRGFGEIEGASRQHIPFPADLVERNAGAAQPQTDKQPADLLDGQGTPEQRQDRGHKSEPNHRPKL